MDADALAVSTKRRRESPPASDEGAGPRQAEREAVLPVGAAADDDEQHRQRDDHEGGKERAVDDAGGRAKKRRHNREEEEEQDISPRAGEDNGGSHHHYRREPDHRRDDWADRGAVDREGSGGAFNSSSTRPSPGRGERAAEARERGWGERGRPLSRHSPPSNTRWPPGDRDQHPQQHQRGSSPPPRSHGSGDRSIGRRSQGPPPALRNDSSSPHRRHHRGHGDDEAAAAAWLPEARSGRLSYPPATFESRGTRGRGPPGDRDRDHRRGFHQQQQQFYGSSPLYHDRRDELAHYPPPPRSIPPAYRDGRDAFGRDWPPPGRGGVPRLLPIALTQGRGGLGWGGVQLRDYDLQLGLPSGSGAERRRKRVRVAPLVADEEARLEKDADTAAQLVRILDRERAIDSDALLALAGSKQEEQEMVVEEAGDARAAVRTRLHRSIEYLRRVHLFCYYCAEQFESRAELHRVCGDLPHRRSTLFPGTPSPAREAVPPEEVSWLAYLDARLEQRLSAPAPELCTAKLAVEQEVDAFLEAHVKREDEKKYRCAVPKCTKLFMAPDFVRKHLKLKHPHLVEEATRKAVEEQYFQNYVRDPRRILPSMPEATLSARPEQQQLQQQRGGGAGRAAVAVGAYSSGAGVMGDAPAGMSALSSHSPRHRDTASPLYAREPVGYAPAFPRSRGFGGGRGGGGGGGGRFGGHHRPGYVDLDAPPEDASLGEQRTTIDYGDLDAVPEPPPSITSRLIPASATALDD
ncbi:uncharacterized protein ACA1_138820 [Acanthamoeba castellanii str. Neff]|uniref:C2H2-type domain-containing protein n=1 Tax=Acanthamoeba castellanii (strain ATCC 30010 / Neff) TaxID=1257118 RepID=L8GMB8_ACACF|nr:uncharacterized protein ACA1_138820 [Acanthamoeba castellanii str. Neff]ELR14205.1 hypothetical protein ACA1_138820 [Acanthamoeba castellanii str. Neff]